MTRQLSSGIDTLVLALNVHWKNTIFFQRLKEIKDKAVSESKESPSVVHYRSKNEKWIFSVQPYGVRGYEWFLQSSEWVMRVGNWIEPKSRPSIMVEISNETLWRIGAKEAYERIIDIINQCGGVVIEAKVSRVDLCMDLLFEKKNWDDVMMRKTKVCRGRKIGIHLDGIILETLSVGIGKIRCRLYDKIREIKQKSKKFWMFKIWGMSDKDLKEDELIIRVEFQIRREVIKELGAGNCDEFFNKIDEVWAYCTKEWLQFKSEEDREHKYRKTLKWWLVVQENFMGVQGACPAIREKAIKIDKDQLIAQLMGIGSSLTAVVMEEKFIDGLNFKEIDRCMMDVIELQRLEGNELSEYKERVIRKRVKYYRTGTEG